MIELLTKWMHHYPHKLIGCTQISATRSGIRFPHPQANVFLGRASRSSSFLTHLRFPLWRQGLTRARPRPCAHIGRPTNNFRSECYSHLPTPWTNDNFIAAVKFWVKNLDASNFLPYHLWHKYRDRPKPISAEIFCRIPNRIFCRNILQNT